MSGRTRDFDDAQRNPRPLQALVDRPVRVAMVGVVLAVLVVTLFALDRGTGLSGFVHAAPPRTDPARAPADLEVLPVDHGFDGQFYYRLAISPFSKARYESGVSFDIPSLRQQRIGYPLLAGAISLGNRKAVPFALLAVNICAVFALGWLGAELALISGRAAAWGLLLPLYPGFVYSLGFDLAEIVASTFMVGAILATRQRRTLVAILSASAAVLTRETTLILPMGFALSGIWSWVRRTDEDERNAVLATGLIPIAVFSAWELWLRSSWGSFPLTDSGNRNVGFPFAGLVDELSRFLPPTSGSALFRDLSLAFLVFVLAAGVIALAASAARHQEKVAFVLALLLIPLFAGVIWAGATSFMRASTEAYVLAIVILLSARTRVIRLVAVATVATLGVTIASEVVKAG
ncbi:MAG: AZOBR_p60025 family cell surface glycopolymer formation protein [Acidimicrobiia bacterium]